MDSPNSRLQRHQSLPSLVRRRTSLRSNPYVGWFRHAPSSKPASPFHPHARRMKTSPYVGWFRHSPSSWTHSPLEGHLVAVLSERLPKTKEGLYPIKDIISGHLRGGGKVDDQLEILCRNLQMQSIQSSSTTVRILTKLACWFLFPTQDENPKLCDADGESSQTMMEDQEYRVDYHDDYDTPLGDYGSTSELGVSSQAEAYYAHHAAKEVDYSDGQHRLDYVITQIDIVRMSRNASRHLDVESIWKLPTITYRRKTQDDEEPGWSWTLVPDSQPKELDSCVICLEAFADGDELRVLPCNHSFHCGCIDRWLSGSHSFEDCYTTGCPTCKRDASDGSVPSWAFAQVGSSL